MTEFILYLTLFSLAYLFWNEKYIIINYYIKMEWQKDIWLQGK